MDYELKSRVSEVNKALPLKGLVELSFGNASAFDSRTDSVIIKPSGVPFEELYPSSMIVTDLKGEIKEGEKNPSVDLKTHLEIYRGFEGVGGIVHTHSSAASSFAQAGMPIDCYGTTHADHFYGSIPIISLKDEQIRDNYEENVGREITDYFDREGIDPLEVPACLVQSHGPFVWGKSVEDALDNAIVLEKIARMNIDTKLINPNVRKIDQELLDKHFLRKHGKNAYYGQSK